ncbi:glycosyltransferase family 2 protein [Brevibacillus sp. TJ4]|uniref:glycosyltransferase family 2 protein n=1 Tax=Brevibacillus sp. TJ4 TaxID=3234853 RepID=UPI0037D103BE
MRTTVQGGAGHSVSVIISAMYTTHHLQKMVEVSQQLGSADIVVAAASHLIPEIPTPVRAKTRMVPVEPEQQINPFSGRALAASHARGAVLLFLGEDRFYSAMELQRFLFPILHGRVQVLLSCEGRRHHRSRTTLPLHSLILFFHELLGRTDLGTASLFGTPHAITQVALRRISTELLQHPAHALYQWIKTGVRIGAQPVEPMRDAIPYNPQLYGAIQGECSFFEKAVIREQIDFAASLPKRNGLTDGRWRREELFQQPLPERAQPRTTVEKGSRLSVIIPARDEAGTIEAVIREVKLLNPQEVIVVVNGSRDGTAAKARACGGVTVEFAHPLGVDSGRAVGASIAAGDILLFVDADFVLPAQDLYPFVYGCEQGIDLALNDQSAFFESHSGNVIVAARQALTFVADRKDLGTGSMLAVPFALRKAAFATLGWSLLACPPLAQMAALKEGLRVELVHAVDSFALNRFRPEKHLARRGHAPAVEQIMGDHIEAIQYWHGRVRQQGAGSNQAAL